MLHTELHRHLDVALRRSTLLEMLKRLGHEPQSTSLASFEERLILRSPMADLNAVLAKFELYQKVFDRPETLERIGFEAIEDCRIEGTRQVELRFSPSFVCEKTGLSWDDALTGFETGLKRGLETYPEMRAGLICIATREYGIDSVIKTVEFFLNHRTQFIGFDLAGNEIDFPCVLFREALKPLVQAEVPITIHAGEAAGPENIWQAIELLGARRIGHGIQCINDPELVEYLAQKQICLEICPTSNWLTQSVPDLTTHPIREILHRGVPVSINTDDPSIFGISLPHELEVCRSVIGMQDLEIKACFEHARRASFLPGSGRV